MNFLKLYGPQIQRHLDQILNKTLKEIKQFTWDERLVSELRPLVKGGKQFRGSLFWAMYNRLTPKPRKKVALAIATALELYGSALLIQDDILDEAQLRRGLPTLHHTYRSLMKSVKSNLPIERQAVFATGLALTVTDLLLFTANQLLATVALTEKVRLKLIMDTAQQFNLLVLAQAEDLRLSLLPLTAKAFNQKAIERMYVRKTSLYSVEWPISAAVIAAGQTNVARYQPVAQKLGLLYQLVDDKLGLFGQVKITGKETTTDVRQGKKTLYAWFAVKKLKGRDQKFFLKVYGNPKATASQINQLKKLLIKTGVVELVEQRIQQLQAELIKTINHMPRQVQSLLLSVTQLVVERQK